MKRILLIIFLCCNAFADSQVNIDSLLRIWNDDSQDDDTRISAIRNVAWVGYLNSQPDSAWYYSEELLGFSRIRGNARGVNIALTIQATYHKMFGNLDEAIRIHEQNIEVQKMAGNDEGVQAVLGNLGSIYAMKGEISRAISSLREAENIASARNDTLGLYSIKLNLGFTHFNNGEREVGLDFFNEALDLAKAVDFKPGIANGLSNIGSYYVVEKKDYRKGLYLFHRAKVIREEMNDVFGVAAAIGNIAECHVQMGQVDSARLYLEKNLRFYQESGETPSTIKTQLSLASVYERDKRDSKAEHLYLEALDLSEKMKLPIDVKTSAKRLSTFYQERRDFESSMKYYKVQMAYDDTLRRKQNQKELIKQEYLIQYEKKAAADSVKAAEMAKVTEAQLTAEKAENKRQRHQQYYLFIGLGLAVLFGVFIFNRFQYTRKQNTIIEEQKREVDNAYMKLEEKSGEILDSISYAKRIQQAILPSEKMWDEQLKDSFVLYKPKDIVAGDFFWMAEQTDSILFAAADCTGHGVPGAMVSVICNGGLNRAVNEFGLTDPGKILDKTREIVIKEFEKSEEEVRDGMDIALCSLARFPNEEEKHIMHYSGAHNSLWIIRKNSKELTEIKADKQPIGKYAEEKPFTTHRLELSEGDTVYVFSDGFSDQFGGEKGKKFKAANFKRLLVSLSDKPIPEQKRAIDKAFEDWKGELEQVDDVCVIGIRV